MSSVSTLHAFAARSNVDESPVSVVGEDSRALPVATNDPKPSLDDEHDALYRECYPKFTTRRNFSPRSPLSTLDSGLTDGSGHPTIPESASTLSSVMVLTPPPLHRRTTLPTPLLAADAPYRAMYDGDDGNNDDDDGLGDMELLPPPPSVSTYGGYYGTIGTSVRLDRRKAATVASPARTTLNSSTLSKLAPSPYLHRSPFMHLPERRSAPKRSFDISVGRATVNTSSPNNSTGNSHIWPPLTARSSHAPAEPLCPRVAPLVANNSLGLEITHIEEAPMSVSPTKAAAESPTHEVRRMSARSATLPTGKTPNASSPRKLGKSISSFKGQPSPPSFVQSQPRHNTLSPPVCRSPLRSLQIANAISKLDLADEGTRSVEAAAYELGRAEANYISRRLAEEQRKRLAEAAKDRAAADEADDYETRGRSRTKKRAGSYSQRPLLDWMYRDT